MRSLPPISPRASHTVFLLLVFGGVAVAGPPVPHPIATRLKVGCYYFPGFFHAARWSPLKDYGHPRPLLGYYRDGLPEVSDWHIKWAVENGISFFIFDWYYDLASGRVSAHNAALDRGFLRAKYRGLMQFALMWCNEEPADNPPYTEEQMITLGKNLGRYFRQPNYLRIAGRPVVVVSRPMRVKTSFGAGFRGLLPRISQAAGLGDSTLIYFVAQTDRPDPALRAMGFAAATAYNYAGHRAGKGGSRLRATYDDMIAAYEQIWKRMTAPGTLPYLVPVSPGWDSRPWYGPRAFVRVGSSPEKFQTMCERAGQYADPRLRMVVAECWNEFGEGSYLEPCRETGFEYLHALRRTFGVGGTYPPDAVPTEQERARLTFRSVPPGIEHQLDGGQRGNLLVDPGMEEGVGWTTYDGGAPLLTTRTAHGGRRCLRLEAGQGVKPVTPTPVVFLRSYRLSVWGKCSPGATIVVRSALFDRRGKWLGKYERVGESAATEWTRIERVLRIAEPAVGAINLECTAAGGAAWIDDASLRVAAREPPPEVVFRSDCDNAADWTTFDGGPVGVEPVGKNGRPVLVIPAGVGVKTATRFNVVPGSVVTVRLMLKCDQLATALVQCAAFDDQGKWITGRYLASDAFSWQDWIEVTTRLQVPTEGSVPEANVECVAQGGRVLLSRLLITRSVAPPKP